MHASHPIFDSADQTQSGSSIFWQPDFGGGVEFHGIVVGEAAVRFQRHCLLKWHLHGKTGACCSCSSIDPVQDFWCVFWLVVHIHLVGFVKLCSSCWATEGVGCYFDRRQLGQVMTQTLQYLS